MGRPVPEDDNKIEEVATTTAAETEETETVAEETEEEVAEETVEETAEAEEAEEELSESALEAISADERAGWVPEKRVKEIVADREAARRDAELARNLAQQLLEERERQNKPAPAAETKQDFDAELKALKQKYKDGEIEMDDYLDARDAIAIQRAEAAADAKFKPVVEQLQTEAQRQRAERAANELEAAAKPIYTKFPFLDITSSAKNMEAIGRVIEVRDELIRSGIAPVRALKLAAAEVGPEYAHLAETEESDATEDKAELVRKQRVAAARRVAAETSAATPPSTGKAGAGEKTNPGKITLSRSVEDAERYEAMTAEQKKNVIIR